MILKILDIKAKRPQPRLEILGLRLECKDCKILLSLLITYNIEFTDYLTAHAHPPYKVLIKAALAR